MMIGVWDEEKSFFDKQVFFWKDLISIYILSGTHDDVNWLDLRLLCYREHV